MIRITDVRVTPRTEDRLRAFVNVTLDEVFVVRGLKIIEGHDGRLFVAMPSRKRPDGTFHDIAHPITPECRFLLEDAVLAAYTRVLRDGAARVQEG
jgi:stage V sporulation protein G